MAAILQICTSRSWGGMEMHVGFLSRQLAGRGHRIMTVCSPASPLEQDLRERGFAPHLLGLPGYFHPLGMRTLRQWLTAQRVEIIHAHYSRDLWTIVPALATLRQKRTPLLLLTKHIGTRKAKLDLLHTWIYRRVNYVIAISEVIRQNLLTTHPVAPDQVGVVHHGVDLHEFSPPRINDRSLRDELGFAATDLVFGIMGRLQVGKGYLEFLEMAYRISRILPQARFLLVGEATRGEPEEAQLILNRIQELQLGSRLRWLGFRKDVPRVLAAMDIFVFPSHAEAFGLVLIEAMAAGKAVISSKCDGVLDIVRDQETGLLVPPRDLHALTQAALHLAQDEDRRRRMGEAGRALVLRQFTAEAMLDRLETIYGKLMTRAH